MIIATDSREQLPYLFRKYKDVETVRVGLKSGDYSLVGYENQIAFERKSVADLVGTLVGGHERFLREMQRLQDYEQAFIVVEGTAWDIAQQIKTNAMRAVEKGLLSRDDYSAYIKNKYNTIWHSLLAYEYYYRVRVALLKDRAAAEKYVVEKCREFLQRKGEGDGGTQGLRDMAG